MMSEQGRGSEPKTTKEFQDIARQEPRVVRRGGGVISMRLLLLLEKLHPPLPSELPAAAASRSFRFFCPSPRRRSRSRSSVNSARGVRAEGRRWWARRPQADLAGRWRGRRGKRRD